MILNQAFRSLHSLAISLAFVLTLLPGVAHADASASCLSGCQSDYDTELSLCTSGPGDPNGDICTAAAEAKQRTCNDRCGQSAVSGTSTGGTAPTTVTLLNPLGLSDPRLIVGRIIKGILSIIGTITLAMFMYGGVLWITSMGEPKKVEKGKSIFVWTTLGLGIIAIAYTAVNAIMNALRTGSVT